MSIPGARLASVLLVLAAVTVGAVAVRYLNSPLRFDESEWPPQAEGILRHGVPKVLYSEDSTIWVTPYQGFDAHYGMWHPPVYLYSIAASIALFGRTDWAVRLVSLAWMALSTYVLWLIVAGGSARDRALPLRVLPLAIVFLAPLAIEGAFYVDIDNSSLSAGLFLMAYVHLRFESARPGTRALWLAAATAFACWSKLTTEFTMAAAIIMHGWWRRGTRRALGDVAALAGGVLVFAATYWAYCAVLDYPATFMLEVSYLGKRDVYTAMHSVRDVLQAARWNIVWISPAAVLAVSTALVLRVQRWVRTRESEPLDVLWLFGPMALAEYVAVGVMGKYTVPAAMALAALAGHELAGVIRELRLARVAPLIVVAGALTALHVWIGPLQLRPSSIDVSRLTLARALADPRNGYLLLSVVAGLLGTSIVVRALTRYASSPGEAAGCSTMAAWAVGVLVYIAAANPAGELRLVTAGADRSPLRPFADRGFREVVFRLNQVAGPDDVILAPKDIGYYFVGRHYRAEIATRDLQELAPARRVRFVVDSRLYPVLPDWTVVERRGFVPVKSVGDYVVFERGQGSGDQEERTGDLSFRAW